MFVRVRRSHALRSHTSREGDLFCSGREWIDYVEYSSDFPEGKQLFVQRIYENQCQDKFDMINGRLGEFKALVDEKIKIINGIKG